jgi:hypothetical protein
MNGLMRIEINVLGALEATVDSVSVLPTANKPRQLLATLALNCMDILVTRQTGYELSIAPECVDVVRYHRLAGAGRLTRSKAGVKLR